jgi:hypothetical protein
MDIVAATTGKSWGRGLRIVVGTLLKDNWFKILPHISWMGERIKNKNKDK